MRHRTELAPSAWASRSATSRLLEQALIHSSYVNEHPSPPLVANERLEFLGDAVLSLIISRRSGSATRRTPRDC